MSLSGRLAGLTGSVISDVPRLYSPYGVGQAVPAPDVRPPRTPRRGGADRVGGGTPTPPPKRGCALSGLSRRSGLWSPFRRGARPCARPRSPRSPAADPPTPTPRRGGADRVGGYPHTPTKEGLRPLWTLPPERLWSPFRRGARPCARPRSPRSPAADPPTPTPRRGRSGQRLGGFPQAPAKEGCARPRSPRSPAADPPTPTPRRGGADRVWGVLQTPAKEGCALSKHSRPEPSLRRSSCGNRLGGMV